MCVQERVDSMRASLSEGKHAVETLTERMQNLQAELTQSQLRRQELETELADTQEVCVCVCVMKYNPRTHLSSLTLFLCRPCACGQLLCVRHSIPYRQCRQSVCVWRSECVSCNGLWLSWRQRRRTQRDRLCGWRKTRMH